MNRFQSTPALRTAFAASILLAAMFGSAHASRPLSVDDANVSDAGKGYGEFWGARGTGRTNSFTLAPAYAPIDGIEIGVSLSRDMSASVVSKALQLKWRITKSSANGCNFGAVFGASHQQSVGNTPYVNGLFTCNGGFGALHVNLGASRAPGGPTLKSAGLAYERELGPVTAHVEWFGQQQGRPTVQMGLRRSLGAGNEWQIDGTLGRSNGDTVFSLGLKYSL